MATYTDIHEFLVEQNMTHEQMDEMWSFMYDKNWKIKNLTDMGKTWSDMNKYALLSLIEVYNKAKDSTEMPR